jgi:hypothetical protein
MATTVTSVSPGEVPFDGGYSLDIFGTFTVGNQLQAYVGVYGDPTKDYLCYSGIPGQGNIIYAKDSRVIRAWSPMLYSGGPFQVTVVDIDAVEQDALPSALYMRVASYRLMQLGLRAVLPPYYDTGHRRMDQIGPLLGS